MIDVAHHNAPPRIWLNARNYHTEGKPTLAGRDLLSIAREMFGVGKPARPGQQSLFEQTSP